MSWHRFWKTDGPDKPGHDEFGEEWRFGKPSKT
jgi:hypothetical protein